MTNTFTSHAPKCQWESDNAACDAPAEHRIRISPNQVEYRRYIGARDLGPELNVCGLCLGSYRDEGWIIASIPIT